MANKKWENPSTAIAAIMMAGVEMIYWEGKREKKNKWSDEVQVSFHHIIPGVI